MYLGPRCPDRLSYQELIVAKVEVRICKVLDLGVIPIPSASIVRLQKVIASVRVSTLGPVLMTFVILSFHYAQDLEKDLGGGCGESWDVDPPADATGQEVRHASSEGA
jgi:hypothetical protein